jgi:hypothetical protein
MRDNCYESFPDGHGGDFLNGGAERSDINHLDPLGEIHHPRGTLCRVWSKRKLFARSYTDPPAVKPAAKFAMIVHDPGESPSGVEAAGR